MASRWWVYQRERFPVAVFGLFIASVCAGVLVFASRSYGADVFPWRAFGVSFACTFLFFLQLRIADEHKDYEDDSRSRPYRPVQRGLVTLAELRGVAAASVAIQVALVLLLSARLLPFLAVVLTYLGLMSREFFCPRWLKSRPVVYLLSHQVILPLIYLFVTACDWAATLKSPPPGLSWVLCMGYCSGMVVEIGRKIRVPGDEEPGVETYSALWGRGGAVAVWLVVMVLAGVFGIVVANGIGIGILATAVVAVLVAGACVIAWRFLNTTTPGAGKRVEAWSGLWTVGVHATLVVALFR